MDDLLDGSGTPFEHMRVALGAFRTMGEPFSAAWVRAIATLPRGSDDREETLAELQWGRAAWQAAYEGGDYEVVARPAGDDGEDTTILAYVAAAVGASDAADPAGVRTIVDPPESPSAAQSGPVAAPSESVPA